MGDEIAELARAALVSPSEVVEDQVILRPGGGRRSLHLRVERRRGRSLFVKRPDSLERPGAVAHEAAVYRRLSEEGIGAHIPRLVAEQDDPATLALELIEGAVGLDEAYETAPAAAADIAGDVGRMLALLHAVPAGGQTAPRPLVFALARPDVRLYSSLSTGDMECLRAIQAHETDVLLLELAAEWEPKGLMHGDVRAANILVGSPQDDRRRVWLVDLEYVAAGDPCWDVGCLLAHHLGLWIASIPDRPDLTGTALTALASRPFESLQPAMVGAVRGWLDELANRGQRADLVKTVRYAGAALIELAFSLSQDAAWAQGSHLLHLQVGHNVLARPHQAGVHLIGLDPGELLESA